ncbi:hypothetical protein HOLleu_26632 [Holothuria leucospilota]|uniref:Uncharacterized protein n=1 Tax=Holothuria leucospilota TaxID=206669 RepID=A0A9Q1H069_HOLLE|nr:hypothetical protein HOLleu_26632 [Holothuria leucospilota]
MDREPSDSGNNWGYNPNPYDGLETGESGGGPSFLSPPMYHGNQRSIYFKVRGSKPMKMFVLKDGQQFIEHVHSAENDNLRCNIKGKGFGRYTFLLVDSLGKQTQASVMVN